MVVFTHIKIGQYYIKQMKKRRPSFKIDRFAFIYGNIKPDISKMANLKHHFEETFTVFYENMLTAQNTALTRRERSLALGISCHFLCDYFCKYHAKQPYIKANIMAHLFYEFKLHFAIQAQIKNDRSLSIVEAWLENGDTLFLGYSPETVKCHLMDRIAFYKQHPETYQTDIAFAFSTIKQLMGELMIEKTEEVYDAHRDFYGYIPSAS
ncbi:zinc dependent phospholipase C family protein [Fusibacter paucivorans]|uniref:Zinc dependent phospholipase C family protein n=1 Tax=Fusibacter paucivorans TaxID=76009 RepID=A0ABS5PJM6_9FIRM|nr:zinc dependent phospholipase C family protein [Fusibacter paucivorans]MBS7525268.1 zinc dependent phospholipase C family protein [Fusibacter paucivorans]